MENVLSLSPVQQFIIIAVNAWMFVIFPVLVLRKLNRITNLLESQIDEDGEDETFEPME
ncbi:MAG: hypothetical protein AB1650_05755 [Candidatus Omnitrophota bacterium]